MNKINYLYIILLTFFACTDLDSIISKQVEDWNLDYKLNLNRIDSGNNKTYTTISWNSYTNYNDFNYYKISFNNVQQKIFDASITNDTIELSSGEFSQVNFSVYNNLNIIIASDTIQVYTREVEPISNLNYSVDGTFTYDLSWEPSPEIDFEKYGRLKLSINSNPITLAEPIAISEYPEKSQ